MDKLNDILRTKQALGMAVESWSLLSSSPGWVRDKIVAIDHFPMPECSGLLIECVIASPAEIEPADYYYVSLLINGDNAEPMRLDFGYGAFERPMHAGNLIFLDASVPVRMQGKGPYHLLGLAIGRSYVAERIRERFHLTVEALNPLYKGPIIDTEIPALLTDLLRQRRGAHGVLSDLEIIDRVIGRLLLNAGQSLSRKELSQLEYSDAVQSAINYMNAHYGESIARKAMADNARVSEGHLARLFQSEMGTSMSNYLRLLRLSKSRELLIKLPENVTVTEIGKRCGYPVTSNFLKAFEGEFGMSPGKYRDRAHKQ